MGIAHAGHDQCAHCYFQYVKPALVAERHEVKRRRAIKKGTLSPANRALINEVDLKEPQMRVDQVAFAVRQESPQWIPPMVEDHIYGLATTVSEVDDALGQEAAEEVVKEFGAFVNSGVLSTLVEPADLPKPLERQPWVPRPGGPTGRKGKPPITDDMRLEIAHAYEAGEPVLTIARRFDVSRGSVLNIATELGVKRPSPGPRPQVSPAPEEIVEVPIKTRTTIEVPHDTPLPAVNGTAPEPEAKGAHTYEVEYTVVTTGKLAVRADNVGQAFVAGAKHLTDGQEILTVKRID